ncbi:MAG: TraB/GumN family protein [Paludibacteraceae bacterium]|nr:TraB/GumN family protein [Paludibacteraceae bacterium]
MIASKKYWIIVLLFSVFSFPLSVSRAQLLYEISGNSSKQKSYLLATNRLVDMQFLDTIPNVFKCFSRCKTVLTEFAMQDYEAIAALRQAALLPDSVKLSDFYTEEQYRFIDNCLRVQVGMGLDKLCRMKPSYLTEMLRAELFKQWLGYDEQRSMETFFEAVAAERDIPVLGLDNIGETMYMLFDREPFEWQCKELLKAAEYPENEVKQERTIKAMYLDGRLADIAFQVEGPDNTTTLSYSDYQVYCARNQQWVKRLRPHLADGACFITLNAIFLGGEKGLIQQLKAAGYRVRPVNRGITIKLKK